MMTLETRPSQSLEIRLRGRVQGVGLRPVIWRVARELGVAGEVLNDPEGVLLRVGGDASGIRALLERIKRELPPLARLDAIETRYCSGAFSGEFRIAESSIGRARTEITPDAVVCATCIADIRNPHDRHYRYPFTSCTHCGPRLSIVTAVPYDRAATVMAPFVLCPDCRAEYDDPGDRRFHAQAIACPNCGPQAVLIPLRPVERDERTAIDDVARAARLLREGTIIAVKGLGGYQLACKATDPEVVVRLRRLKRRQSKPFALMARDLEVIRRYCTITEADERELTGMEAPIVLLDAGGLHRLPESVAPGVNTLGFMLPTTPLHALLLQDMDEPMIMTSGNFSGAPPIVDDREARKRLAAIAAYALVHDRRIANRVDDSVVRTMDGKRRVLRRARGFAPSAIKLPPDFAAAPALLATGGQLKATFCLLKEGRAVLSQHIGDLESAANFDDYRHNLALYRRIFAHVATAIVVDRHPEYLSSKWGAAEALERGLALVPVQHHHAHVAACLAENRHALAGPRVLGIVMDGLGFGDDGTIWGGEFLLADYRQYRRVARLKPIRMPGGAQAVREPWRNLHAHLKAAFARETLDRCARALGLQEQLLGKPAALVDAMIEKGLNSPLASSCGRLFDAVAAALNVCRGRQTYEGEAAIRLEALAQTALSDGDDAQAYPFHLSRAPYGLIEIDPTPMWKALIEDIGSGLPASTVALRFHKGLADVLVATAISVAERRDGIALFDTVALTGGSFQNRILFERVAARLRDSGYVVLAHAEVPANDGGLALGQAAIGAAHLLAKCEHR